MQTTIHGINSAQIQVITAAAGPTEPSGQIMDIGVVAMSIAESTKDALCIDEEDALCIDEEDDFKITASNVATETKVNSSFSKDEMLELFNGNEENAIFFMHESQGAGMGGQYLLQKAFDTGNQVEISSQEIIFCLEMTKLLLHLTKVDKARLAFIVGCVVDRAHTNIFQTIRVPRSVKDFEKLLLTGL
jgi:hypothetical protein